jgi:ESAT-6 family protein
MRATARLFDVYAQTVRDEAAKMWASHDTIGQVDQVFRDIVNMLNSVRDGLIRDANNYKQANH